MTSRYTLTEKKERKLKIPLRHKEYRRDYKQPSGKHYPGGIEEPKITLNYALPKSVWERLTKNLQVYTTQ